MDANFFVRGFVIGFLLAAPIGPIGLLCIHRTLIEGRIHGLVSGLGAATADTIYAFIAAFGLILVPESLAEHQIWFRCIGGVFLCGLGVRIFLKRLAKPAASDNYLSYARNYASTFLFALMNPMCILAFAMVFAGLGATSSNKVSAALLVTGVFTGSMVWWVVLSSTSGVFRKKLSDRNLVWLNRIMGTIITAFGLIILFNVKI